MQSSAICIFYDMFGKLPRYYSLESKHLNKLPPPILEIDRTYFASFRIQKVTISKLGNSCKLCLFLLTDSQKCLFMSLAIWHGVTFRQNVYFTLPCIFLAINISQKFPLRLCKSNTEKVTLCDPTNQYGYRFYYNYSEENDHNDTPECKFLC